MTVKSILIENVKGIARCELKLEGRSLVVIRGANATGKTSILDAIRMMFEAGGDPSLIRKGAKSAKVVMLLSDGSTVQKYVSPKAYKLEATSADGTPIPSPKAYVDSLASSFAFDPLAFCRADKKKRAEFLMQAMPIEFAREETRACLGDLIKKPPFSNQTEPPPGNLEEFDRFRARVYELRKIANAAVKELDLTVANLRKSLPPADANGEQPDLAAKIRSFSEIRAALDTGEQEAIQAVAAEARGAREQAQELYEQAVATARDERDRVLAAIQAAEAEACDEARGARVQEREAIVAQIADAQSQLAREGEIRALSAHLAEQTKRLAEKSTEAIALDRSLIALDNLRKSKLEALPIHGLEVRDGEVWYEGVPFDQLNQATQYVKSIEIGCLKMGDLPLIVSDEAEHLDSEQWELFCKSVEESGLQVICARVDDGVLRGDPQNSLIL